MLMKRIIYTLAGLLVLLTGCERYPDAGFYASQYTIEVGDVVRFHNTSYDAATCEWDFGDGTYTTIYSPSHAYTAPGTYSIMLTVWSPDGTSDMIYRTIRVSDPAPPPPPPAPTVLEIEVLEYYDEYPIEGASVLLYGNYDDWYDEYNPIMEGFTDYQGIVVFENVAATDYYVDVWEANHNNYLLADEDLNFIHTLPLVPNEVNYFIAWVDYVPGGKKSKGHYKLKKLEKRSYDSKRKPKKPAPLN